MEPRLSELEVERTGKGGSEKRSAAIEEANVKGKDTLIDGCQQPKDSYANWAEMRCGALIYTRVARDWRE